MVNDKKGWTADRVRAHLANAVYLEMWTVPLYLTAAYSIKVPVDKDTHRPEFRPATAASDPNQFAFNNMLSVAIQEMLHVELAANILNAVRDPLDSTPVKFSGANAPSYAAAPPCLDAEPPAGVSLQLGPMDENQARLFQWIEEDRDPPPPPYDPLAYHEQYNSIGNFYKALEYGVKVCWNDLYPEAKDAARQKDDWGSLAKKGRSRFLAHLTLAAAGGEPKAAGDYPFSIKVYGQPAGALTRAEAAMTAIMVQGEGAGEGGEVPPPFVPTDGDPIEIALDETSHWQRFTDVLGLVEAGRIDCYDEAASSSLEDLRKALNQSYSAFLVSLDTSFSGTTTVGLEAMAGLGNRTLQVWQNGQKDGAHLYEWEDPREWEDPSGARHLHACQGLNEVTENGKGPGESDCATAFFHVCSQTNTCKGQGGCGYPADHDHPDPSCNPAEGDGGCGTPIPDGQFFVGGSNANGCVWTFARELLRQKVPGFPAGDPPPNEFRQLLTPTSVKSSEDQDQAR